MNVMWLILQVAITASTLRGDMYILLSKNIVGMVEVLQKEDITTISDLLVIFFGWIMTVLGHDQSDMRRCTKLKNNLKTVPQSGAPPKA